MKRILGIALLVASVSLPVLAAKNSQEFELMTAVKIGDVTLAKGYCQVSWTEPQGDQVQLTIKTKDKKTVTIPARVVQGKQTNTGALIFEVNGEKHIKAFVTKDASFIVQDPAAGAK